jgi:uncharacterized repeat protein (TIGR01451 family)
MSLKKINTKTKQITILSILAFSLLGVLSTLLVTISDKNISAQINYNQYDLRYKETIAGNITLTGNSSGLSLTQAIANEVKLNEFDSIDVFTTLDQSKQEPGYPNGTTRDWKENSSSAILTIPQNSKVKFAMIVWGGNYYWEDNATKVVSQNNEINTPIEITTPKGTAKVKPDSKYQYLTQQEVTDYKRWFYSNTADITPLVSEAQSGTYIVKGIPSILPRNPIKGTEPDNIAGWSLAVAYENTDESIKNLTMFTGSQQSNAVPASINGFGTPPSGKIDGSIWVSAMEGDGGLTGDQLKFGENKDQLQPLKTENNLVNNFFSSQINNKYGRIDTTGSFGNFNSKNYSSDALSRQGWDITTVNISDKLKNNQKTASIQGTSNDDNYIINFLAIGVEVYAPKIEPIISVDKQVTNVGEKLKYTVTTKNTGKNKADNLKLTTQIPQGTSFVEGSISSDRSFTGNDLSNLNFGSLDINQTISYSFEVLVNSIPESQNYKNKANAVFDYIMAAGDDPVNGEAESNEVITTINTSIEAIDDYTTTEFETPIILSVTNNDKFIDLNDGSIMMPSLITDLEKTARNGTAEVLPSGQIKYTPNKGFNGSDSFEYQICDVTQKCDTAIVTVNVLPKGQIAPIKTQDINSPNTPITITQSTLSAMGASDVTIPTNLGASTRLAIRSGGDAIFWMVLSSLVVVLLSLGVTIIGSFDNDFNDNL